MAGIDWEVLIYHGRVFRRRKRIFDSSKTETPYPAACDEQESGCRLLRTRVTLRGCLFVSCCVCVSIGVCVCVCSSSDSTRVTEN